MKAAVIERAGAAPAYAEFAEPVAGEGRKVMEVVAAGVHPVVRSLVAGGHYLGSQRFPVVPGVDCVARAEDGSLVYTGFPTPPYGTLAERVAVPGAMGFALPDDADPVQVAGAVNPGLATWLPLQHLDDPADATVVVTAATGVAGRLAVQNARALGVRRIVALGRRAAGLEAVAAIGATETVRLTGDRATDARAVRDVLDATPPDLVLDLAWGWVAETLFAALVTRGLAERPPLRYVSIGISGGEDATVPGAVLRGRPVQLVGSGAGSVPVATIMAALPGYLELLASGRVRAETRPVPLADVATAWAEEEPGVRNVVVV